jgi:hypothetical protein
MSSFFVKGVFKIGYHELFAWAGFESRSSWSLPPEKLGLQVWATGTWIPRVLLFMVSVTWSLKVTNGKFQKVLICILVYILRCYLTLSCSVLPGMWLILVSCMSISNHLTSSQKQGWG